MHESPDPRASGNSRVREEVDTTTRVARSRHDPLLERTTPVPQHDRQRDLEPLKSEDSFVPDWKPFSLRYGPMPIVAAISILLILYTYCYAQTRARSYVAVYARDTKIATKANDIVFRFGPTLIAVILTELILHIVRDLNAIAPFEELPATPIPAARKRITDMFTKHSWIPLPKRGLLLTIGCFILVPSQSGLFEKTVITLSSNSMDVKYVNRTDFIESLNGSTFVSTAAKSVFGSAQQQTPDLVKYRWVWRQSEQDPWVGLMPFQPNEVKTDIAPAPAVNDITWKVDTEAVLSDLACVDVLNMELTISKLERDDKIVKMNDVSLSIEDRDGCVANISWASITSRKPPGLLNPITPDGHFAIWSTYRHRNISIDNAANCKDHNWKSLVLAGPFALEPGEDLTIDQRQKGWAAIVCTPKTRHLNSLVEYEASEDGSHYKVINPPDLLGTNTTSPEARILANTMERNILNNNLIYNLTSPGYGKTFWGQTISQPTKPSTANDLDTACQFEDEEAKDRAMICKLTRLASDLWGSLFAMTISTSAQIVPPEKWSTTTGTKQMTSKGWAVSTGSYVVTLLLYLFLVGLLWFDSSLHNFAGPHRRSNTCLRTQRYRGPTGLYGSPTSIAGLAFLMQRRSVRRIFKGVDLMSEGEDSPSSDVVPSSNEDSASPSDNNARNEKGPTTRNTKSKMDEVPRSSTPFEVHTWTLTAVTAVCLAVIAVVVKCLVVSKTDFFTIWKEHPKYNNGKLPSEGFRAWFQKQIFEGGPVLVLTTIGAWWGMIDGFYRKCQPFASVSKVGDAKSMRLTYMHDFHGKVTWCALRNSHFRLGFVTLFTLLSYIAVIFSAGIFSMVTTPSPQLSMKPTMHAWRSDTFGVSRNMTFPTELLQEAALSSSFSGPLWRSTKNEGNYWWPHLIFEEKSTFSHKVTALKANMTCTSAGAISLPASGDFYAWNVNFTKGECADQGFNFVCADKDYRRNETDTADSLCVVYGYITPRDCPGVVEDGYGRWLILSINTLDGPDRPDTLSKGEPSQVSAVQCTPNFFEDELNVTVSRDAKGNSKSDFEIISSRPITPDHWVLEGTDNITFADFSNSIISNGLAQYDFSNSDIQGNILGIMTVSDIGSTERLFDETLLGAAASNAYSTAFAALAAINVTEKGDTLFAKAADPNIEQVAVYQHVYLAKLERTPLYVGLALLCIYLLAIPLVRANRDRRTLRDVKHYVNVMAMMYDSEFLDVIAASGETNDFKCLDGRIFAMGIYRGVSGAQCVGIDFKENVTKIDEKSSEYRVRGLLRWG